MKEIDIIVIERIQRNECPICGHKIDDNAVVVEDIRCGKVKVCSNHKVSRVGIKE
jgi:hypothetical protein